MAADFRGPTNGGGAGRAQGQDGKLKSKCDREDPEILGGADGAGHRRGSLDPGGAGATESRRGAEGMKAPDGGFPRCRIVDARLRRSRREEGAWWTAGPRWRRGELGPMV